MYSIAPETQSLKKRDYWQTLWPTRASQNDMAPSSNRAQSRVDRHLGIWRGLFFVFSPPLLAFFSSSSKHLHCFIYCLAFFIWQPCLQGQVGSAFGFCWHFSVLAYFFIIKYCWPVNCGFVINSLLNSGPSLTCTTCLTACWRSTRTSAWRWRRRWRTATSSPTTIPRTSRWRRRHSPSTWSWTTCQPGSSGTWSSGRPGSSRGEPCRRPTYSCCAKLGL